MAKIMSDFNSHNFSAAKTGFTVTATGLFITVSHGSAYTVVRATQQVNGNGNFGVSNSVTPKPID